MGRIELAYAPVGVRFVEAGEAAAGEVYHGVSYCEAVRRATAGETLMVAPGSVEVCKWSPPILGLKEPETAFEKEREPQLGRTVEGVKLSRLDQWPEGPPPQVVLVRAERESMAELVKRAGPRAYDGPAGIDRTMVMALKGGAGHPVKSALVRRVNRALAWMNRFEWWGDLTVLLFKREWTSRILNFVLDRAMANMSMCRNSTVIPYLINGLNVSHFCTGAISWGRNPAHLMTGGMPLDLWNELKDGVWWN